MTDICKVFPGVRALDRAHLSVEPGEVHALVGENGAGKSTLIKILGGVYQMDEGRIRIRGNEVRITGPHDAMMQGVSTIHQELMLIPDMTVAQNLFLGREPRRAGMISWKTLYREAKQILEKFGLDIDPRAKTRKLGVARQQMVEIARAMSLETSIIVMDEPTATLTKTETDHLFDLIRRLKNHDISVVYISHRMEEIFQLADRATVLRDGVTIDTVRTDNATRDEIVRMMVGRDIEALYTKQNTPREETAIEVRDLTTERVQKISFSVRRGEILGVAGLVGSGRTEVVRGIFGLDPILSGTITVNGEAVRIRAPKDAIAAGLGYLTEDRKEHGIVPEMAVVKNITLSILDRLCRLGVIRNMTRRTIAESYVNKLSIRLASLRMAIKNLSGGNQQKTLIARSLATDANILLLDEPTRGIDVGAKQDVYEVISNLAKGGIAVVFVSSELMEVLAMSDRVLVMWRNRVAGILTGTDITQENIMQLATGGAV